MSAVCDMRRAVRVFGLAAAADEVDAEAAFSVLLASLVLSPPCRRLLRRLSQLQSTADRWDVEFIHQVHARAAALSGAEQRRLDSRALWQGAEERSGGGVEEEGEQQLHWMSGELLDQLQQRLSARRQLEEEEEQAEEAATAAAAPPRPPRSTSRTPLCQHSNRRSEMPSQPSLHASGPLPAAPSPPFPSLRCSSSSSSLAVDPPAPVLAELGLRGCLELLQDYLVAHTLKDCSLLVNCIAEDAEQEGEQGAASPTSHSFTFSIPHTSSLQPDQRAWCAAEPLAVRGRLCVSVVDLEVKDVERIPSYFHLDQLIVRAYTQQHELRAHTHSGSSYNVHV